MSNRKGSMNKQRLLALGAAVTFGGTVSTLAAGTTLDVSTGLWEVTSSGETTGVPPIPPEVLARLPPAQRAQVAGIDRSGNCTIRQADQGAYLHNREDVAARLGFQSAGTCQLQTDGGQQLIEPARRANGMHRRRDDEWYLPLRGDQSPDHPRQSASCRLQWRKRNDDEAQHTRQVAQQ